MTYIPDLTERYPEGFNLSDIHDDEYYAWEHALHREYVPQDGSAEVMRLRDNKKFHLSLEDNKIWIFKMIDDEIVYTKYKKFECADEAQAKSYFDAWCNDEAVRKMGYSYREGSVREVL